MPASSRRALSGLLCVLAVVSSSPARAGDSHADPRERFPPAWEAALRTTGDDALYLLTSPLRLGPTEALVVGAIGAGVGGLSLADREIRGAVRHRRKDSLAGAADGVSYLGFPPVLLGVNVAGITVGEEVRQDSGDRRLLDAALVATEAQLLTLGLSEGISYGVARSRPGRADDPYRFRWGDSSFPSSHTSQAFAVAAVVADRYDLPVGVLAYGLAGLVGLSRLVQDKHWATDVAAGAVLGLTIGKALSARHGAPRRYLDFFPFADPATKRYGLVVGRDF